MVDKVGRILAMLALIAVAIAVLGRGWLLTKEGQPSDQELRSAMADVLSALDVHNSVSKPILHKFLYVELGHDVSEGMTQQALPTQSGQSSSSSRPGHRSGSRNTLFRLEYDTFFIGICSRKVLQYQGGRIRWRFL